MEEGRRETRRQGDKETGRREKINFNKIYPGKFKFRKFVVG
jgi:hypothetical protein